MWYFDTNILAYSLTAVEKEKMTLSQELIKKAISDDMFLISPVVLQELVFVLAKLKLEKEMVEESVGTFSKYCRFELDAQVFQEAFQLCGKLNVYRSINDAIHLKFAEKYSKKLLTFDKDFKKFREHSAVAIEVLTSQSPTDVIDDLLK